MNLLFCFLEGSTCLPLRRLIGSAAKLNYSDLKLNYMSQKLLNLYKQQYEAISAQLLSVYELK